jgi:hypothetical protein
MACCVLACRTLVVPAESVLACACFARVPFVTREARRGADTVLDPFEPFLANKRLLGGDGTRTRNSGRGRSA